MTEYSPMDVAVALSLYGYNVSPEERSLKVFDHFNGDCAEPVDLLRICLHSPAYIATEMAYPSAKVYVDHALERYGEESKERNRVNAEGYH